MATTPRLSLVTNDEPDTTLDDSYPQHFLDCREGRHHWKRIGAFHAYGEITIARHCVNCGGDCWDHWSPSGHRLRARTYDMPDGYRISGGVNLADVRAEVIHRVTVYASADALNDAILGKRKAAKS